MAKQKDLFCFDKKFLIIIPVLIGLYLLFDDNKNEEDCNCNK